MPSFTIESSYRLPVFRHRTYEAATIGDACRLAIADEDWQGQKEDYESAGPTYLTGVWPGVDSAYEAPALALPPGFAEGENPLVSDAAASSRSDDQVAAPDTPAVMPRCRHCGSGRISRDANACWDEESQSWSLLAVYDSQTCEQCGAESNHLVNWVPVAVPGTTEAFRWDVIEALQMPALADDAAFQTFCGEVHACQTVELAAATWRNRAPG